MADRRTRLIALGGALAANGLLLALLLSLGAVRLPEAARLPALVAVITADKPPPAPPPPDEVEQGAPAPPSRGETAAPAPPIPPRPLPSPTPAAPAPDPGPALASGLGSASGNAAGTGGEGTGSGAGGAGSGRGAGVVTPPRRIEGGFSRADYRRATPERGAAGTVVVSYRVRPDGLVDQCRVTGSSGYAEFDEATCRLIEQRFRFLPARDESGRAVDWTIRTDYTWAPS